MIEIECGELTTDEQLALAASISDALAGKALALVNGARIVIDEISGSGPRPADIEALARNFVTRRKDAKFYSLEWKGSTLVVHSPDPLSRSRARKDARLPDNLLMCPFCPFVTPYQEAYNVHVRSHGFGVA